MQTHPAFAGEQHAGQQLLDSHQFLASSKAVQEFDRQ
jgi:hypothetical protein